MLKFFVLILGTFCPFLKLLEEGNMAVSYKKLWHMLLDRNMKKKDLQESADLTAYAMNKLSRDENVTTETLGKICKALKCSTDEIIEFLDDDIK